MKIDMIEKLGIDLNYGKDATINPDKINHLISFHKENSLFEDFTPYDWSDAKFWLEKDQYSHREISDYFTIGNAINFKYWDLRNGNLKYCKGEKGGIHCKGARYMWRCLKIAVENDLLSLNPKDMIVDLKSFDEEKFDLIFSDDNNRNPFYMAKEERIKNLRNLGQSLEEKWDNSFYNLIKSTDHSLVDFVRKSHPIRAFDDGFLKLIMVNSILHIGRGLYDFDLPLIPGIDYQLMKQMLRIGAIDVNKKLMEKLQKQILLTNSEAYELRSATLDVFRKIMTNTDIPGDVIDNKWWMNSKNCSNHEPVCDSTINKKCPFDSVCDKRTEILFPLEDTRYY